MKPNTSLIVAAGVLATMFGLLARADDPAKGSNKGIEDPARVGRPGDTREQARPPGATVARSRELSGTVVKADATTLYLEHMGAIVPLKIDQKTRFSGEGVKSSRDLTEGQSVRASFTVKETTNVADQITVASASSERPPAETGTTGTPPGRTEGTPGHPPDRGPAIPPVPRDPGTPTPRDPGDLPGAPKY